MRGVKAAEVLPAESGRWKVVNVKERKCCWLHQTGIKASDKRRYSLWCFCVYSCMITHAKTKTSLFITVESGS